MDAVFELLMQISGGDSTLVVSAFVFLSAAALAFGLMAVANVRFAVKRRASEISSGTAKSADDPRSLRYASKIAAQRLIERPIERGRLGALPPRRLNRAGYHPSL